MLRVSLETSSSLEFSVVVPSCSMISTWTPFSARCTSFTSVLLNFRSTFACPYIVWSKDILLLTLRGLSQTSVWSKEKLLRTLRGLSHDRCLSSFRGSSPTWIPLSTPLDAGTTWFACVTLFLLTARSSSFKFSTFCSSAGWMLGVKLSSTLWGRSFALPSSCAMPSRSLDEISSFAATNSSLRFVVSIWDSFKEFSVSEILFSFSVSSISIFSFSRLLLCKRLSRLERLVRDSINSSEIISFSSKMVAIFCFMDRISISVGDIGLVESSLLLSIQLIALSRSNFSTCEALLAKLILSTFTSTVENFLMDLSFSSSSLFEICANRSSSDKSLSSASSAFSCVPTLSSNRFDASTCEESILSKPLIWCFASCISFDIWELSSFSRPSRDFKPSVTIRSVAVVSFSIGKLLSGTLFCLLTKALSTSFRRLSFSSSDNR